MWAKVGRIQRGIGWFCWRIRDVCQCSEMKSVGKWGGKAADIDDISIVVDSWGKGEQKWCMRRTVTP